MNEVEKYGLFAVVIVGGLIGGIAWWGGEDTSSALTETTAGGAPVSIPFGSAKKPNPNRNTARPNNAAAKRNAAANLQQAGRAGNSSATARGTDRGTGRAGAGAGGAGRAGERTLPVARTVRGFVPQNQPFDAQEPPVSYPGERSAKAPAVPRRAPETHVVREGDTLSSISKTYLGSAQRWNDLVTLNPGIHSNRLQLGQVIVIKAGSVGTGNAGAPGTTKAVSAPVTTHSGSTYVVQSGDTLGSIAQRMLGSTQHMEALFQANRGILESPDTLAVGQTLTIP